MIVLASDRSSLRRLVGRPWWMTTARVDRNPFDHVGLEWCHHCKQEVDTDTEAHCKASTYVYRKRCLRCGGVISFGVNDVNVLQGQTSKTAIHWALDPGKDRR